jgi:hypothetical protein
MVCWHQSASTQLGTLREIKVWTHAEVMVTFTMVSLPALFIKEAFQVEI